MQNIIRISFLPLLTAANNRIVCLDNTHGTNQYQCGGVGMDIITVSCSEKKLTHRHLSHPRCQHNTERHCKK